MYNYFEGINVRGFRMQACSQKRLLFHEHFNIIIKSLIYIMYSLTSSAVQKYYTWNLVSMYINEIGKFAVG